MKKDLDQIAREDGRYDRRAFEFLYEGLGYTAKHVNAEPGHVSGQSLCEGLRRLALSRFGRLAMPVLHTWGVKSTRDFGEIVYLMVSQKWMSAKPDDSIEDFDNVYDFQTAFKDHFEF